MEANFVERVREAQRRALDYPEDVQPLVSILLAEAALMGANGKRSIYKYETYQELILNEGSIRKARLELPEEYPVMEQQQCYLNSYHLACDNPHLTYCEGYALHSYFPVAHAWVEDKQGRIIDPTWAGLDEPETHAYYAGLRFDTTFLLARSVETGWVSIFAQDWMRDAEILRHGFVFDDDGLVIGMGEL